MFQVPNPSLQSPKETTSRDYHKSALSPLHIKETCTTAKGVWGSRASGNVRKKHPQKGAFPYGQIKMTNHLSPKPEPSQ